MITLEISTTEIRVIEVNGKKVTSWARQPLEPGMFSEEIVTNPQALGNAIRTLIASLGVREKNVTASVSGLYSLSRIVSVPGAAGQPVTEKAVMEAAEAVIPVSADELYLSWHDLSSSAAEHLVLVLGIPRDMIDNELRALKLAGVKVDVIDLKTLALARAVNRPDAILLNIDETNYDIVILTDGTPEILRTTAWLPGVLPVEDRAEQLISALEITANYHNTHHPGSPLDPGTPLFITGHLSGDTALTELLKEGLVFPAEQLTPPLEYPPDFPVSEYAVNTGLAIKASAAPRRLNINLKMLNGRRKPGANSETTTRSVDLNLLPQAYKPWRPSVKQAFSTLAVIAVIGMLFPFYQETTKQMRDTATVQKRYDAVNTVLLRRKAELAKREPLEKSIVQYNSLVALGGGIVEDLTAIREIAGELGVRVQGITHSSSSISFNCDAPDYITFRQFITALKDSGRFTVSSVPPEGYPYIKGGGITLQPKR